jgi:hypothetical protein
MKLIKLLLASSLMVFAASVFADSHDNGAFVVEGGACGLFQVDGSLIVVTDPDNNFVGTGSKNGNAKVTCHASGVIPSPGPGPLKLTGFGCTVLLQDGSPAFTTNSKALVTPDGEALLNCWIH